MNGNAESWCGRGPKDCVNDADDPDILSTIDSSDLMVAGGTLLIVSFLMAMALAGVMVGVKVTLTRRKLKVSMSVRG